MATVNLDSGTRIINGRPYHVDPTTNKLVAGPAPATPTTPTAPTTPTTPTTPTQPTTPTKTTPVSQVVPGAATGAGQINVADYAGQQAINPKLTAGESLSDDATKLAINPNTAGTNITNKAGGNPSDFNATANEANSVAQAPETAAKPAATYQADKTADKVAQQDMTAAQGQVDPRAQVEAPQIDTQGVATGTNADGSINYTGQALQDYAQQDLNTVDPKATLKGQLDILQNEFVNPQTGQPQIPDWAAGTARSVSRIAAFSGMTGTAAVAAMSQALHEASISVAQQDAQFFQTLTLQNLNNKQAATINRANVLAHMDEVNADNRLAAAIQNSKNFMDMDLANLNNEQQARVINTQNRVQSILEDSKAENAARLFGAQSQNDMNKFYDELNSQIHQFNANQANEMLQFNVGQVNSVGMFNSQLESQRQQFYQTMQYNVDLANAKWRQTVSLTNTDMKFQAASTDVKNMVGLSVEQLNQIWDRSDALLDYIWKSSENEKDRQAKLGQIKLQGQMEQDAADSAGLGSLFGSVLGGIAGSDQFLDFLFK